MPTKTLMILGGSRYVVPLIDVAHELGLKVVTCDYLPDNPAHKYSDEYRNISITDRDLVLEVAQELQIAGIVSFASDPGVLTGAYVAERMGLPYQASYESTRILQNKNLFRKFLSDNKFNVPWFVKVRSAIEAEEVSAELSFPVIVKPTDSAGSKGVRRVDSAAELFGAVEHALSFSLSGECLIEEFLEKLGDSSDADGFTVNGRFTCISFTGQKFDTTSETPFVPSSYQLPSTMPESAQATLSVELQRLATLLDLKTGTYNIETRLASNGLPYIMEVSPRGGGNRLSEFLQYASGVDLVRATVQAAMGIPVDTVEMPTYDGIWFQEVLQVDSPGYFDSLWFDPQFEAEYVRNVQVWIRPGDFVEPFTAANYAFGSVFMRFENQAQLDEYQSNPASKMKIVIKANVG